MTSSKEKMWPQPETNASETPAAPTESVPEWLGNRLRTMFSEVMDEPVPDEFKALLEKLDAKEKGRPS
ncbi:MAG: NepR family anti-sigma factor [Steroidobacteraceae bacterium]